MKKIRFTNNFHNTEAKVIPCDSGTDVYGQQFYVINRSQYNRMARKLCGMTCTCGTIRGHDNPSYYGWLDSEYFQIIL